MLLFPDKDTAGDVLQEVFVKIWKQSATYDATKVPAIHLDDECARNASIDMPTQQNSTQCTKPGINRQRI